MNVGGIIADSLLLVGPPGRMRGLTAPCTPVPPFVRAKGGRKRALTAPLIARGRETWDFPRSRKIPWREAVRALCSRPIAHTAPTKDFGARLGAASEGAKTVQVARRATERGQRQRLASKAEVGAHFRTRRFQIAPSRRRCTGRKVKGSARPPPEKQDGGRLEGMMGGAHP